MNSDDVKEENRPREDIPRKYQFMIAVVVPALGFSALGLTWFMLSSDFGIDLKRMPFFQGFRNVMTVVLFTIAIPAAIFGEYLYKDWKKRKFFWTSVLTALSVFAIFLSVTVALLTLFDITLANLNVVWQIPLALLSTSVGLVTMACVVGSGSFKKFVKRKWG